MTGATNKAPSNTSPAPMASGQCSTSGQANGRDAEPMPTVLSTQDFAERCREIVATMSGHVAHRELDLLTNQVLSSLGYSEGIAIFEAAVREWHRDGLRYPARQRRPLRCLLGFHDWKLRELDLPYVWFDLYHCRRCPAERHENPCP